MQTQEIPDNQWGPFFDELSKRHQGEHVTVELLGRDIGVQMAAEDQSLMGISVDAPTGACKIDVMAGGLGETNIAHEIAHPIHVRVATSDDGREEAIEIESEGGPATLVRFLH